MICPLLTRSCRQDNKQNLAETIEQCAGFQELSSGIVHALVKRIVFFGEGKIEIEYIFADEMKEFVSGKTWRCKYGKEKQLF